MPKGSIFRVHDLFCGAGGSTAGAKRAGAEVTHALNHWRLAIETHARNHPEVEHDCMDVSAVHPGRYDRADCLIASPECRCHSIARKPKLIYVPGQGLIEDPSAVRSRATMQEVVRWTEYNCYSRVIVENVVDVVRWPEYPAWLQAMRNLGYEHQEVYFNSQFAGAPQSRDRIYICFWKKGDPPPNLEFTPRAYCHHCGRDVGAVQTWKNPAMRWGRYGDRAQYTYTCPQCRLRVYPYYRPALSIIDWAEPIRRIGERSRPLAPATIERIRQGLKRFSRPHRFTRLRHPPFLPPSTDCWDEVSGRIVPSPESKPGQLSVALASMPESPAAPWIPAFYGRSVGHPSTDPLPTVTTVEHHGLCLPPVEPWIVAFYGGVVGNSALEALTTVTCIDHHGLCLPPVEPFVASYYSGSTVLRRLNEPVGTLSTHDRHSLVVPTAPYDPDNLDISDVRFRMLSVNELKLAMAFALDYELLGSKTAQVKLLGNAVTPPVMEMLLEAMLAPLRDIPAV